METEKGFREEYSFLSNFTDFDKPMRYQGIDFPTNEHFYQAMKFLNLEQRRFVSQHPKKGLKKFVTKHKYLWRKDWDEIKLKVMEYGLRYKFSDSNPILKRKLIETGNVTLIEYNWWHDKFWGVSLKDGEGENNLGKLLMDIRKEINEE